MKTVLPALKIAAWMAVGALAAQLGTQALAHGNFLTRLDVQQAVREALRTQPNSGPSDAQIQQAVRQALSRCRFKGQRTNKETTSPDDEIDFQGQIIC